MHIMYKSGQLLVGGSYVFYANGDLHRFLGLPARVKAVRLFFSLPEKLGHSAMVKLALKKQPTIATMIKKAPKPTSV